MSFDKVVGIAYPILKEHMDRIFSNEKLVFFKMCPHESLPKNLKKGDLLFFYLSKSGKIMVGHANIKDIRLLTYLEVRNLKNLIGLI